uniref:Uncharacterized protein n=1 Tax=Arundo donax TaxID=35708 RepID=A0A0A9AYW6_ARUDO
MGCFHDQQFLSLFHTKTSHKPCSFPFFCWGDSHMHFVMVAPGILYLCHGTEQ